jgi:hypothetical protein
VKVVRCKSWGILSDFQFYEDADAAIIVWLNIESNVKLEPAFCDNELDWFLYKLPNE